jgi:O-antigen/teichoic acid export membrane protein
MGIGQEVKGVAKHSLFYGFGAVVQRVLPFLLLPLYLNYLEASDYGIKEIIAITVDLVGIIISLGITTSLSRFYYEFEDETERKEVVSSLFIAFGFAGLVGVLVLSSQRTLLARLLLDDPTLSHYFLIAFVTMWFNAMCGIGYDYLRVLEKSKIYVIITNLRLLLALSLNVYFVAVLKLKVLGILLSGLICSVLFFAVLVFPILMRTGLRFSPAKCVEMLKFGLPFIATNIAAFIVHACDRVFLKHYGALDLTGIYSVGYRMGSSINAFVTSPFIQVWLPRRFAIHRLPHAKPTYARVLTYYFAIVTLFGVWMSIVSRDALLIIGQPSYYEAAGIIPIVVLAYTIFGLDYHFEIGIMLAKKTKYVAYVTVGSAVLNILLNFLLIPRFKMIGAAYATVACFAARVACTRWISNRLYPLHFEYGRLARIAVVAVVVFIVGWMIPYPSIFQSYLADYSGHAADLRILGVIFFGIRSVLMLLFPVILHFSGFWLPEEKQYAGEMLAVGKAKLSTIFGHSLVLHRVIGKDN